MAENYKLILRFFIRDKFTDKLVQKCNIKSRECRGGSRELYKLLINSRATPQYMKTDRDHLQIVSGIGHTFLRYKDDEFKRYLYIDPTIAQFEPSFDGIFVGDKEELYAMAKEQKDKKGYKLNLGDYLGPDYPEKKYPLPPLTIETYLMNNKGGTRRRRRTRKS